MSDLTEFLLARIAEDEAHAREAMGATDGEWSSWNRSWDSGARDLAAGGERIAALPTTIDEHVCRHDPARVLAECEAKRGMVYLADHAVKKRAGEHAGELGQDILLRLALPYADHPDYREEWRP